MTDSTSNTPNKHGYGLSEKKKAELDSLTEEVIDAQYEVEQLQAIVSSLTSKSMTFEGYLLGAHANQEKATNNRDVINTILQNALELRENSETAWDQTSLAEAKTIELSEEVSELINKLIYSAETINKLANKIRREKAMNPLIPDELITLITTTETDANNAVALTLVALKSTFAAKEYIIQSKAVATLEFQQSISLYKTITYPTLEDIQSKDDLKKYQNADQKSLNTILCLKSLIDDAYKNAQETYNNLLKACTEITKELDVANSELSKAEVKLQSLQAGLAAANAAALAS